MKNFEAVDIINQYCYDNNITGKENIAFNLAMQALNKVSDDPVKHDYKEDCIKLAEEVNDLTAEVLDLKDLIISVLRIMTK